MNLFEQLFEAFFILSIIVNEYLNFFIAAWLSSSYGLHFVWILWSFGDIDRHKGLYFFKVRWFSTSQLLIDTHWLGLVYFLIDNDGCMENEWLTSVFCPGRLGVVWANFNLNGVAVMFAYFGWLPIWLLLPPIPRYLEVSVVSLEGLHDFRCLFAEWHRINLYVLELLLWKVIGQINLYHSFSTDKKALAG